MTQVYEIWKIVENFPNYAVSNQGRVMIIKSRIKQCLGKIMKAMASWDGYEYVELSNNGYRQKHKIHRLVATAFLGKKPAELVTNHIDGNKRNNSPSNLEYITDQANRIPNLGEKNGGSKLTEETVRRIRRTPHKYGVTKQLCQEFGVHRTTIHRIRTGKRWNHL